MMPQIRNTARYDLEVAGRVYAAGETIEVGDGEAAYLVSNPNFQPVNPAPAPKPDTDPVPAEKADHGRKKAS